MNLPNIAINTFSTAADMADAFEMVRKGLHAEKLPDDSMFFGQLEQIKNENKILAEYNNIAAKRQGVGEEQITKNYMNNFHLLTDIWGELRETALPILEATPGGNHIAFMSKMTSVGQYVPEFGFGINLIEEAHHISIFVAPGIGAVHYLVQVRPIKTAVAPQEESISEEPTVAYTFPEANDDDEIIAEHQAKEQDTPVLLDHLSPPTEEEVDAGNAAVSTLAENFVDALPQDFEQRATEIESAEVDAPARSLREHDLTGQAETGSN